MGYFLLSWHFNLCIHIFFPEKKSLLCTCSQNAGFLLLMTSSVCWKYTDICSHSWHFAIDKKWQKVEASVSQKMGSLIGCLWTHLPHTTQGWQKKLWCLLRFIKLGSSINYFPKKRLLAICKPWENVLISTQRFFYTLFLGNIFSLPKAWMPSRYPWTDNFEVEI